MDEPTIEFDATRVQELPTDRRPWPIPALAARWAGTARTKGRTPGYDIAEADATMAEVLDVLEGSLRKLQAVTDAHGRAHDQLVRDRDQHRTEKAHLVETIAELRGDGPGGTTMAAAAIAGGQQAAEHQADLIVAEARRKAELIIIEARARANEEADRIRIGAGRDLTGIEPGPGVDGPDGVLARIRWLSVVLPNAQANRAAAVALCDDLEAEADRWATVLPLARAELPPAALDVREVGAAS